MINGSFRPWGSPEWLLGMPSLKKKRWCLIGAIGTQERCQAIAAHRGSSYELDRAVYFDISDDPSPFAEQSASMRAKNKAALLGLLPNSNLDIYAIGLDEPIITVQKVIFGILSSASPVSVLLDVSCFPERFFFPILRWLVESANVQDLVVCCMAPAKYTPEPLAYNPKDWAQISTFVGGQSPGDEKADHMIVGAGFLPFGLPELLKKTFDNQRDIKISVILPFPAPPASVRKAWEFVRKIEEGITLTDEGRLPRIGVDDLSGCYDRIGLITRKGADTAAYAPYGPKAHSVAMCLHAIKFKSEVFYTQPAFYHPEYTTGMKFENGRPVGNVYAVRINNASLY